VVFSDFQCPYCSKLATTLGQLRGKYGDKLRVVFRNNPLPFHPRAEPAAELAHEAFARLGNAGFWKAHDLLFAQPVHLEDADLAQVATSLGLNTATAMSAVSSHKHAKRLQADQDLAEEVEANGTPTTFINGRKLVGAQGAEAFSAVIDEELAHAEHLLTGGVQPAQLYAEMQKGAKDGTPTKVKVPAPGPAQPSRGASNAPVTIQIFSDFECPFCNSVRPTLAQLEQEYGSKVRLVWRNLPLAMHPNARPAAIAALEAYKQKGNDGFWKMHDLLHDNHEALDRGSLRGYAGKLGLDMARFDAALDSGAYAAAIDQDIKVGATANIHGTPSFVINGYVLTGAQPYAKFKRLVERALREAGTKP